MFYLKITLFRYRFYRGRHPTYLDRVTYSARSVDSQVFFCFFMMVGYRTLVRKEFVLAGVFSSRMFFAPVRPHFDVKKHSLVSTSVLYLLAYRTPGTPVPSGGTEGTWRGVLP